MSKPSFGFARAEDSPGFLLWQVSITWQRQIKEKLDTYDISHAQFVILAVLLWCEETGFTPIQSFLVEKTKLDKMTVSAALKKLALKKLIKRNEHVEDTRAKSVVLTPKGKDLTQRLVKLVEEVDKAFFASVKISDQKTLIKILNALAGNTHIG